jgi:hypothetical protein
MIGTDGEGTVYDDDLNGSGSVCGMFSDMKGELPLDFISCSFSIY